MTADDRFEALLAHAGGAMVGWDFGYLSRTGRMMEAPLPWSYASIAIGEMPSAQSMLDMGTGGGEFLAALQPLPPDTRATEGWAPNIPVARARLEPLGIVVHGFASEAEPLPYPEASFDLIINRHEAYDPAEVRRALKPGGCFITQQVGGRNDCELNDWLGAPPETDYGYWTLDFAREQLESAGFTIVDAHEALVATRCYDIGALVFYLHAMPWQVEGFSVERFRPQLRALHERISREGFLDLTCHRFLLAAESPAERSVIPVGGRIPAS